MYPDMAELEYNTSEKYQNIRLFTAAMVASDVPLYDLRNVTEHWSRPTPG